MMERQIQCGHPVQCIAASEEGTNYCLWCEEVGRLRQEIDRLTYLHDLDHKLADRFRAERDRLFELDGDQAALIVDCREERDEMRNALRTLHTAVVNVGGGPLHDLYQRSDLRNLVERMLES